MTTIYFIRHSQSDFNIKDDRTRPLTAKGLDDCSLVTDFLQDKKIDIILSSPYKRSVDTVSGFAENVGLPIQTIEDFREHEYIWVDDWLPVAEKQWSDFSYKQTPNCESLDNVQRRNIVALNEVLNKYEGKNIVIGTHGTALSTIINYYDRSYGFDDFMNMVYITPWVAKMVFNKSKCMGIEKIDLFNMT